ncbi:MAG: Ig-like domain-containing protein [Candidatus Thermoplasmatota archaeon]|jgi:hypothetical protein|nr:Ig-like domain-containing protein [Candidatus Thermoplasmatota archaeon]
MKNPGLNAMLLMLVLLLSSMGALFIGAPSVDAEEPPSRAVSRYFSGKITNLDAATVGNFNSEKNVSAEGSDSSNNVVGPFWTKPGDWDPITFQWTLEVDIQNHDTIKPWILRFADRYGWNRTNGGSIPISPDNSWYSGVTPNYELAPDTMQYLTGVIGDMMFTVKNGSSGDPLPGVGFSFDKHPLYNTVWNISGSLDRGNVTDGIGVVLFKNMQLGRDQNNLMKVRFIKEHFNTADETGVGYFPLRRTVQSNYQITLVEDPLVSQYSPSNGAIDVETNKTKVKSSLFVRFFDNMDRSSVNQDTVYLKKVGGAKVPVTYEWDVTDQYVNLQPASDLEFNTQYTMVVTPRVHNVTGVESLWRTFTTTFTTHKRPAIIRGTIFIKGTTDPAPEGSMVRLGGNPPILLVNGAFNLSNVLPTTGGHNVTALGPTIGDEQQYLYFGNWKAGITVNRGDIVDLTGLYVEKRPTRTVIFKISDEAGKMLEGVDITHAITNEVVTTDASGVAILENVLKERTTRFRLSLEHFYVLTSYPVPAGWENTAVVNITLIENEFPVIIKAWTDSAQELVPTERNIISAEAYFRLEFDDAGNKINMDPQTMTTDNLRLLRDDKTAITIDIEHEAGDMSTWTITPRIELSYSTNYTLVIKEGVADQFGNNPFWRDYTVQLRTEGLDPASINGKVTIRERGVEGIPVRAYQGDMLLRSTTSGPNGFYILDIGLTQREILNVRVEVDGATYGLTASNITGLVLRAGGSVNNTDFELIRVPGWMTVFYPKDHLGLMELGATITLGFNDPLQSSDIGTFSQNFTIRGVTDIGISLSTDKRSVIIDPTHDLEYDRTYELSVSFYPDGEAQRELKFASGLPALLGGEKLLINTTLKPIDVLVSKPSKDYNVSRTDTLVIYFTNYSIDASKLQPKLVLKKALDTTTMGNLTFTWDQNGRTLEIGHPIFDIKTEYELFIPKDQYGAKGALIREDFLFVFTTEESRLDPQDIPELKLPVKVEEGKKFTLQVSNRVARPLNMVVEVRKNDQSSDWEVLVNFTLLPLEVDKVVSLNVSDLKKGEYQLRVRSIDPTTGALLDEQTLNFQVTKKDNGTPALLIWIWIVLAIIIIVIIILGVYLFTQSRKKEIDEELKEEFECPECHNVVSVEDVVCPHCGAEFEESAYKCPKCGAMLDHEADECSECGYDFSDQDKMDLDEDDEEDVEEEEEDEDISEMYEEEDDEDVEEIEEDEDDEEEEED